MSDITFTPEQVREIRRRIADAYAHKQDILAAFPLPKVTRFRTFTVAWGGALPDTYRVNGWHIEWYDEEDAEWSVSRTVSTMAHDLAVAGDWTALAAFADVAARPTEEVDA